MMFAVFKSFAQLNDFITPITTNSTQKSDSRLTKFENKSFVKQIQIVKMASLKNFIKDKKIKISIPGISKKLTIDITNLEAETEETFTCFGQFENYEGDFILLSKNNKMTAYIKYLDKTFEIYHNEDDTHTLIEVDQEAVKKSGGKCGTKNTLIDSGKNAKILAPESIQPCQLVNGIRVVALVTPAAKIQDPNYSQTINLAVAQYNSALNNSQVTLPAAKIILGGIFDINFQETADITTNLNDIAINSQANQIRNENAGDAVVLFANGAYGLTYGKAIQISASSANAFSIVQIAQASSIFTFSHEFGHMLGGRHDEDNTLGAPLLQPYAHGFLVNYKRYWYSTSRSYDGTIMKTLESTYGRLLYFSNPNVSYGYSNTPVGNITTADVSRKITEFASTMAAYKPERLTSVITGPNAVSNSQSFTWEANVSCGIGYTYQWAESSNGINYNNISGANGISLTQFIYPGATFYPYKRILVSSSDGQKAFAYKTINAPTATIQNGLSLESAITENEGQEDFQIILPEINTYPNPSIIQSDIKIKLKESDQVRLVIINNVGIIVKTIFEGRLEKGIHSFPFTSIDHFQGAYILKLSNSKTTVTERLIIQK
jgi:Metallo-peptidase family M12